MSYPRIYRYTSIGRPLEPKYPTNKAVLILMPAAAVSGAAIALATGAGGMESIRSGLSMLLIVFGAWALARELAPDDNPAAFVSLGIAFLAGLAFDAPGILFLFATLGLVRIVNRSTGLSARISDSVAVMLLSFWVIYATESPVFGAVAAVAFVLDGSLREPLRRQWIFGLICLGGMVVYMVDHDLGFDMLTAPDTLSEWLSLVFLLVFAMNTYLLTGVVSTGDVGGEVLDLNRVRGGMGVAMLACLQGLNDVPGIVLVVATIAGVTLGGAFRRAFQSPVVS